MDEEPGSSILREASEHKGAEEQERPHMFRKIEDDSEDLKADFIQVMTVGGPTSDEDCQIEMAIAGEKEPCALQEPEIHQWMPQAHAVDKLRAGTRREMDLIKDFEVAGDASRDCTHDR